MTPSEHGAEHDSLGVGIALGLLAHLGWGPATVDHMRAVGPELVTATDAEWLQLWKPGFDLLRRYALPWERQACKTQGIHTGPEAIEKILSSPESRIKLWDAVRATRELMLSADDATICIIGEKKQAKNLRLADAALQAVHAVNHATKVNSESENYDPRHFLRAMSKLPLALSDCSKAYLDRLLKNRWKAQAQLLCDSLRDLLGPYDPECIRRTRGPRPNGARRRHAPRRRTSARA